MTSAHTAPQVGEKTPAEVLNVAVSFAGKLNEGELLTGTPTLSVTPSGMAVTAAAVNTVALTIQQRTVAIGQAVQFAVSSGTVDDSYVVAISAVTNATPAQTLQGFCQINVVGS